MSHTLSANPPPPALHQPPTAKNYLPTPTTQQLSTCTWALDYPELQKACFLARVCEERQPRYCQLRNIGVILQEGPTCGLTALSMLLDGTPSARELLQTARELRYTNNGEMFSAQNLFQLICDTLKSANDTTAEVINAIKATECAMSSAETNAKKCKNASAAVECELHQGPLDCAKVRAALQSGACIFVPYDPDYNHSPCLKYGHKAHWALIIGFLISDKNEFFVLARHGKAKNLAVWSLDALSDSNANLIEFEQPKGYPDCDFLLPPGGIGGDLGLRERAIIVNKLPQENIYTYISK
ncbi:actin maturation protease [Anastrepha ludens]|uniref:actin maturation protease n=1 Tax=Anastrepha ludens TaxID=28586 RepID=UPI0023AECC65|nr:actin maturation protease [Anastrepha ludens]